MPATEAGAYREEQAGMPCALFLIPVNWNMKASQGHVFLSYFETLVEHSAFLSPGMFRAKV